MMKELALKKRNPGSEMLLRTFTSLTKQDGIFSLETKDENRPYHLRQLRRQQVPDYLLEVEREVEKLTQPSNRKAVGFEQISDLLMCNFFKN